MTILSELRPSRRTEFCAIPSEPRSHFTVIPSAFGEPFTTIRIASTVFACLLITVWMLLPTQAHAQYTQSVLYDFCQLEH